MEVLEIGGNVRPQAHLIFPDAKIVTMDIDETLSPDIIADAGNMPEDLRGRFDAIFASHVFEHFPYRREIEVLRGWMDCVKDGGELHIVVPSAEWAAREVLSEKPSPALHGHMLAGQINQWDVHLNIFTMRKLRALFEHVGLSVFRARTGEYAIKINGVDMKAEQHYIAGVKGTPELSKQ